MFGKLEGSWWINTDEDSELYGVICTVKEGEYDLEANGENDIKFEYINGVVSIGKYRRFVIDHTLIKDTISPRKETVIKLDDTISIGVDWGNGRDKAVMSKIRDNKDGTFTLLETKEIGGNENV